MKLTAARYEINGHELRIEITAAGDAEPMIAIELDGEELDAVHADDLGGVGGGAGLLARDIYRRAHGHDGTAGDLHEIRQALMAFAS